MADRAVAGGTVLTQDPQRRIIPEGAVAIEDGRIVEVGPESSILETYDPKRVIDAADSIVIPGLVNAHVHVSDILLRGAGGSDRDLYDWLFNIKHPGMAAMRPADHELAGALFAREALESGVTTVVENDGETAPDDLESIAAKLKATGTAGLRHYYGFGIRERPPGGDFATVIERIMAREPDVNHPDPGAAARQTAAWVDTYETLVERFHGTANGRREVWIAPIILGSMTDAGLTRATELAAAHDVQCTIHVAETAQQEGEYLSSIDRLRNVGALGPHTLLGHCVQIRDRDIRTIAKTGARVAHNVAANMRLGTGVAPVPAMRTHGIPIGLGTDNPSLNDRVDLLADARLAAMVHAGHRRDPGVLPPQAILDMLTIDAARSIGRSERLGSLEPGKQADIVILDLEKPHLTPAPDLPATLVYSATGADVETVLVDGEPVVEAGRATSIRSAYPDLLEEVVTAADRLCSTAGIDS